MGVRIEVISPCLSQLLRVLEETPSRVLVFAAGKKVILMFKEGEGCKFVRPYRPQKRQTVL